MTPGRKQPHSFFRAKRRGLHVLFLLLTFQLASCLALDYSVTPIPTPVPTDTPTSTPTIVWFPASATPSFQAFATQTVTPEMRPGIGDITLTDDFSDPDSWDLATSDQGGATINKNRLILSAQEGVYMISLRHDLALDNFYAEITAQTGLCRLDDSYGILVRASAVAYYRFALYCNGTVSVERISVGTRRVLQKPLPSGDAPPGAPGEVRIGIWAVGSDMRLFLNGRYQFSVNEASYKVGTLGVFVRSAGANAVSVNFTDLQIQEVTYTPPVYTPTP